MLRVLPAGNLFAHSNPEKALDESRKIRAGLGAFHAWQDAQVVEIVNALEPKDLVALGSTSRIFYVFTLLEEPWQQWGWDHIRSITEWQSTWRATVIGKKTSKPFSLLSGDHESAPQRSDLYSDLLYHRLVRMNPQTLPWGEGHANMTRRSYQSVTLDEFNRLFDKAGRPLLIEDMPWGVGDETLLDNDDVDVICGGVTMSCAAYKEYCRKLGPFTECPLFVFDEFLDTKFPRLAERSNEIPFGIDDVFSHLPKELQPRKRWTLYGPARSHSKWHVDPNKSTAFNGVFKGSKRWFMLPPHIVPLGVRPSEDGAEVVQPVSLIEWFVNFYDEFWEQYGPDGLNVIVTDVCKEGEMVFVPRGWWHCVINLEETLAVTWNFVTKPGQECALRFFRDKFDQIFGVHRDRRRDFVKAFEKLVAGADENAAPTNVAKETSSFWDRCRRQPLVYKRAG